jgi:uncharacterized protein (DUF1810 family)
MADDPYQLARFIDAQEPVYENVLRELRAGRKRTHWMWFIFPQIHGLGHSATAQHFAIKSLDEARAYLNHPILGQRVLECARLVSEIKDRSVSEIFGFPDDLKFRSCITLFARAAKEPGIFGELLKRYFQGEEDSKTVEILAKSQRDKE